MNILFLGYHENPVIDFLKIDNFVVTCNDKVSPEFVKSFDYVVSYGYTHILKKNVIDACRAGIINLHISYLPWNRGMYPNFWSFVEDTKKGVSIHFIDEGIDTGDIIFQKEVVFDDEDTLQKTYYRLRQEIEKLFIKNWQNIVSGNYVRMKQMGTGSFHLKKDLESYELPNGWQTEISKLKELKKRG